MSKRLTGLNPLAYMGVEPSMPPNMYMSPDSPTPTDVYNFNLGDFWVNTTTQQLWVLVSQQRGVATWITLFGGAADSFVTDSGTATPSGGALNVLGGTGIATSATGNTITITNTEAGGSVTSLTEGTGITLSPSTITTTGSIGLTVPVAVSSGGTGDTSFTPYAVVAGGTSSTGVLQQVSGLGTSGQALISNGAGTLPSWQDVSSGGASGALVFIQKQTASSVTSLAFTTGITTSFDNYILVFDSIEATQTGSVFYLQLQLSTNGGSGYITTGYGNSVSTGPLTSGFILASYFSTNMGGTGAVGGSMNLVGITSGGAGNLPSSVTGFCVYDGSSSSTSGGSLASMYLTPSTVANAFKIILSNGGTFSGTFTLYGLENAGSSGGTLTVDGNSGPGATPTAGILNIVGSGGLSTTATGNTVTISGNGTVPQVATITLTSAQVKALQTTPILLIPAQGANTIISPITFISFLSYGGTNAFVSPASGTGINAYFSSTNIFSQYGSSGVCGPSCYIQTQNNYALSPAGGSAAIPTASIVNQPIYVAIDQTASGNITGNAAGNNTLTIQVTYEVISVPL